MSLPTSSANSYDELPFPTQALSQTHPDRLATVAALFGLRTAPIDRCRVLELGCGTGGNLIPMAERHPESQFVGLDYSAAQIDAGRRAVASLDLANIDLRHQSILDVPARPVDDPRDELGTFDYILCHGVYSWVPPEIQQRILQICQGRLNPRGVAYVSHNTYPGWHLRSTLREMLVRSSAENLAPRERVAKGRKVLEFLSTTLGEDETPYSQLLKFEIDAALSQPDSYLFHEYFELDNESLYLHEFVDRAAAAGLAYLGDASLAATLSAHTPTLNRQHPGHPERDPIDIEQRYDLVRNRPFRQSLLCHDDVPLNREVGTANLAGLFFTAEIRPQAAAVDAPPGLPAKFINPRGVVVGSPVPLVQAALAHFAAEWPRSTSFDDLIAAAGAQLKAAGQPAEFSDTDRERLAQNLVECIGVGLVNAHSEADRFVATASARPRAPRVARLQAMTEDRVTNRRHEMVPLDQVAQRLLPHLDGGHDREALLATLLEAAERGGLSVFRNNVPAGQGTDMRAILRAAMEESLAKLASLGLLIG